MNGLTCINVELTSRCNKSCWMCGRRKIDRDFPETALDYGDMDFGMVKEISQQVPTGIMVQFHWNGEPLLYKNLGMALQLFKKNIRCLDTNGKRLIRKADELIDNLDVLTVSIIQDEEPHEMGYQYYQIEGFLKAKGKRKPRMVYRCLGNVDTTRFESLEGVVVTRTLHAPMGSHTYEKKVTMPETAICQEALTKLAIDRNGFVSPCVRFDPDGKNVIGSLSKNNLAEIWNGQKRAWFVQKHIDGKRNEIELCKQCDYWGVPIA